MCGGGWVRGWRGSEYGSEQGEGIEGSVLKETGTGQEWVRVCHVHAACHVGRGYAYGVPWLHGVEMPWVKEGEREVRVRRWRREGTLAWSLEWSLACAAC